jgi:hypothetical protein
MVTSFLPLPVRYSNQFVPGVYGGRCTRGPAHGWSQSASTLHDTTTGAAHTSIKTCCGCDLPADGNVLLSVTVSLFLTANLAGTTYMPYVVGSRFRFVSSRFSADERL